jgi:hypothetical protein
MTSLIAWIGVDSHGPASVYLASDSRISWPDSEAWDHGRKVFAAMNYPEVLGYQGDVVFPSLVLGQIVDLIDANLLLGSNTSHHEKWKRISQLIVSAFAGYPHAHSQPFAIVYGTRDGAGTSSEFHVAQMMWEPRDRWVTRWLTLPQRSGLIVSLGSGERPMAEWYARWCRTSHRDTSRSVFGAFCDALHSRSDRKCGGAPQLVGLYRVGSGRAFGIVYNARRYLLGLPVAGEELLRAVEWRNALFERCDPISLERLPGAQRQRAPRGLGREAHDALGAS